MCISSYDKEIHRPSRNSQAIQWLGLHASTAGGMGLIPGWGTKILNAMAKIYKIKLC